MARTARDTYATANADWLAQYDGNGALMIRLLHTGTPAATYEVRANGAWVDITPAIEGPAGTPGLDGAPGGGAIENYGITLDGTAARPVNEFIATGVMMGERGDTPYLAYRLVSNSTAILWFSTDELYDVAEAAAGDTSTDGSTGPPIVERNRLRMPESAGSSISGSVDAGRTAANELLLSTTTANVDITVEFFRYVTSVAQAGASEARVQELINASSLSALQGQVTDAQIPDAIMRDAELTNARVRGILGLTATEVDDLFTGASISGQVITFVQNDGSTATITIPQGAGAMADGVVASGAFNTAGTELTLTLDTGGTVVVDVPAVLRSGVGGITAAERAKLAGIADDANRLLPYKLGNIYIATASTVPDKPSNNSGTASISGITVAPPGWQLTRPEATAALPWVYDCHVYGYATNGVFGIMYGTPNRTDRYIAPGGTGIDQDTANGLIQAALAAAVTGNTETGIAVTHNSDGTLDFVVTGGGGQPVVTDDVYFGTSADDTPESAELSIAAVNGSATIPAYAGNRHHLIARLASEGDITSVLYSDDPTMTNAIGAFTKSANTIVPPDETEQFSVWVSNQALTNSADVEITVS